MKQNIFHAGFAIDIGVSMFKEVAEKLGFHKEEWENLAEIGDQLEAEKLKLT